MHHAGAYDSAFHPPQGSMAGKYLVTCECGELVPAAVHQAGSQVACTCGRQVDVPPLRKLRQLPLADDLPQPIASNWSPRHALAVGGASLVAGLLIWAGYLWGTEPAPVTFPEARYAESIEHMLENGTPLQFWRLWMENREVLAADGFNEITSPQAAAVEAAIAESQLFRKVLLGLAAVLAVLTVIAWFAWPQPG